MIAALTMAEKEPLGERELVEQARSGDREAFGELVRRHRAEALGLAGALTKDAHLAEDVVQEALIRAFLHMGTLMDAGRFMPWFHRIVRNQAYMKLRRGGPFGKELPFAALAPTSGGPRGEGVRRTDWTDVDAILFRLMDRAAEEARNRHHPEECLVRKEMLEQLRMLLGCLNRRERGIFEARFFGELPPERIAALFETTTANVYNSLSRSRVKVQRERIRVAIQDYVDRRAEQGMPRRKVLTPPIF